MPNFRYRALTQNGEIVHGTLSAPTAAEVARRIEYLRLLPIETIEDKTTATARVGGFGLFGRPSPAEVTTFTRDLALLLKAGARLDDALELLASDADVGRLRPVVGKLRAARADRRKFRQRGCGPSGAVSRRCTSRWFASAKFRARSIRCWRCWERSGREPS